MAELADALDSKSSDRKIVWVRSPPPANRLSDPIKLANGRTPIFNPVMLRREVLFGFIALVNSLAAATHAKEPVDQLIPWLLNEDRQLRGIAFSEVIFDATGKRVLRVDKTNAVDQRVIRAVGAACDGTMKRLNAADSSIQKVGRINEVGSHFEDTLRELLNATPGLDCDFPRTAEGKVQRSGYPDLRIVDLESKRIFYLDPKLYAAGSREQ